MSRLGILLTSTILALTPLARRPRSGNGSAALMVSKPVIGR